MQVLPKNDPPALLGIALESECSGTAGHSIDTVSIMAGVIPVDADDIDVSAMIELIVSSGYEATDRLVLREQGDAPDQQDHAVWVLPSGRAM